jgi:hypothetical protein
MSRPLFIDEDEKKVSVFFEVSYDDKDDFKADGGQFNFRIKMWYMDIDIKRFEIVKVPVRNGFATKLFIKDKPDFGIAFLYDPHNYLDEITKYYFYKTFDTYNLLAVKQYTRMLRK